jgi:predicted phage terminase large subunit-like protein
VLNAAGLVNGVDYRENRTNRWFEFSNGSFVHFRSAEDPESLRGAGLDILWADEAAFIPNERAWEVSRPALSDRQGIVITTTTPDGKNWLYKTFWSDSAKASPNHARIEYRSIDNPFFPEEEWRELLESYHPLLFRQEYLASFDAMAGRELHGEWLKYYTPDQLPRVKDDPTKIDLEVYIGVDPAISLADSADRWAAAVLGVTRDKSQAYLLDIYADRIPFPDQIEKLQELQVTWRPMFIGVESVAFQRSLEQQALRIPGFLPVIPMFATGKKQERILSMAPLFKMGRVKIQKTHSDFINEWLDYDSTRRNTDDDCLDAVEIALRTAGALLPMLPDARRFDAPPSTVEEWAALDRPGSGDDRDWDEHFGNEW